MLTLDTYHAYAALVADDLLLLADVPGVLEGGTLVRALDPEGVRALITRGLAVGGMAAKLEAACAALERGVHQVHIGDVRAIADRTLVTRISLEPVPA